MVNRQMHLFSDLCELLVLLAPVLASVLTWIETGRSSGSYCDDQRYHVSGWQACKQIAQKPH